MFKRTQFLLRIASTLAALAACGTTVAQTFVTIKDPECLQSVSGLFTVGGQYTQSGNGVLDDSWGMLVRWQGSGFVSNSVSYDLSNSTRMNYGDTGIFSGVAPSVGSYSTWQRGYQTESSGSRTPGVQLYCNMAGMLINTYSIDHITIAGGGYNDMFGYSWSPYMMQKAFRHPSGGGYIDTDLVVQADISVPYVNTNHVSAYTEPTAQVSIFAYVVDTANPSLAPIALIGLTHDKDAGRLGNTQEGIYCDGFVYFATGNPSVTGNYFTRDPYSAYPHQLSERDNGSQAYEFFRMRVTADNFRNIITEINSRGYNSSCPANGYSTDINDYYLKYGGVISEVTLWDGQTTSGPSTNSIDQLRLGLKIKDVGFYRRY